MEGLLNRLYWLLGSNYGHTVRGGLGRPEEYVSSLMNELDTFVGAVLHRVGIAPDSRDHRDLIEKVELTTDLALEWSPVSLDLSGTPWTLESGHLARPHAVGDEPPLTRVIVHAPPPGFV